MRYVDFMQRAPETERVHVLNCSSGMAARPTGSVDLLY
jgi:hypothetical protein